MLLSLAHPLPLHLGSSFQLNQGRPFTRHIHKRPTQTNIKSHIGISIGELLSPAMYPCVSYISGRRTPLEDKRTNPSRTWPARERLSGSLEFYSWSSSAVTFSPPVMYRSPAGPHNSLAGFSDRKKKQMLQLKLTWLDVCKNPTCKASSGYGFKDIPICRIAHYFYPIPLFFRIPAYTESFTATPFRKCITHR